VCYLHMNILLFYPEPICVWTKVAVDKVISTKTGDCLCVATRNEVRVLKDRVEGKQPKGRIDTVTQEST
jgi:hypothetical protein